MEERLEGRQPGHAGLRMGVRDLNTALEKTALHTHHPITSNKKSAIAFPADSVACFVYLSRFLSRLLISFCLLLFLLSSRLPSLGAPVCNADYPCEGMSRHATFENFGMAFLTLFQVSTGDNWNGIMKVRGCAGAPCSSMNGGGSSFCPSVDNS